MADVLRDLYEPYLRTDKPFLVMSPESAEMTKYVANALLSTKISFINEMANLCERTGADINEVRRGIGHDSRIGFAFLFPGVGYGGSCFPKDVRALAALAAQRRRRAAACSTPSTRSTSARRRSCSTRSTSTSAGKLAGRTIAVWGLAFKPGTDDIREAPALVLIDRLLAGGAKVRVHDPEAMDNVRQSYGDKLIYCEQRDDALEGADCPGDHDRVEAVRAARLRRDAAADAAAGDLRRPQPLRTAQMKAAGFAYHSIGRASVV